MVLDPGAQIDSTSEPDCGAGPDERQPEITIRQMSVRSHEEALPESVDQTLTLVSQPQMTLAEWKGGRWRENRISERSGQGITAGGGITIAEVGRGLHALIRRYFIRIYSLPRRHPEPTINIFLGIPMRNYINEWPATS